MWRNSNIDGRFDHRCNDVHRVRAQHDDLGTGPLQDARIGGQQCAGGFPIANLLECLDRGEVVTADHEVGGVRTAETGADTLVDDALVLDGALPAHPAK
jgi:hypothetical protein